MTNPFPDVPDDLWQNQDWTSFNQAVVTEQIAFVNSLTDEQRHALGAMVDGYEVAFDKQRQTALIVHRILSIGLRLIPV